MPAQTHPAPATSPSPEPPPGVPTQLTCAFPFRDADNKEIVDPQKFYDALSLTNDGFFPLGVNGFPHGGIHFGNGSAARLDQTRGVRCIADGEIVAHKIDDAHPHLQFTDGKWAAYSTGFVLVRHRLTMPPAPNNTSQQPADESHDIYSLYMHMADWTTYLAAPKVPRPYWWDVDAYSVLGKDRQHPAADGDAGGAAGAFVWTEPKAGKKKGQYSAGQQVGFLPEGCEVIIGEKRGPWGHIQTIAAGGMTSPTSGGEFGLDDSSLPWEASDARTAGGAAVTPKGDWGWLFLPGLQSVKEPKQVGHVVVPPAPIPVKAGTLLGQIGEYQDYERATPLPPASRRKLLHLEVFADDGFSAFLTKSRTRAAQLPADQKTLLVIDAGAKLVQNVAAADRKLGRDHPVYSTKPTDDSPSSGPWVKVQPRYSQTSSGLLVADGPPVWIERDKAAAPVNGMPAWSEFPLRLQDVADPASGFPLIHSRAQLDALDAKKQAIDEHNVRWWRVPFRTADGKSASGWVCSARHPGTRWENPWAWPGFEIVDATGINLTDAFKRNLLVTDTADWQEKKAFEPSAVAVNNSPLLLKLEQTVAGEKSGGNSGKVTAKAMQAAMRVPSLAQAMSHVILRYESEWGGDMSRWNAITPLMRNAKGNWLKELERIKKLQWWDEVKGKVAGFPGGATVLHIHPVALVANFATRRRIDIAKFLTLYKDAHSANFGWYESASSPKHNLPPLSGKSEENLKTLLEWIEFLYASKSEIFNIRYVAYMLATSRIESYDFHTQTFFGPFSELISYDKAERDYGSGPTALNPTRAIAHHNNTQGDGYKYRGRGLVQITWKANYENFTPIVGVNLADQPDEALSWKNAAVIMVEGMIRGIFTGKKLSDYINEFHADYVGARRIINGTERNIVFAEYAKKFETLLMECI
ncbi:putative eF hand domain protein [Paraburkholderia caffeinilytica]|uniref:Glycoside hydrolase family 19 catalytic domain-containing protein n=1 Tax=Paraburkholderia caffeinilytica TaxID=1761016 RepID=A0ABQ1N453_9BURK|nr:lytic transglycosylase domain-containing protein [Paraburkholderia caffeinilytica]AXL52991.1 putative eF hand domain protein [Paraburkholderia caffeinilytica]GGC50429.1 hypothetical protein GCM10011400_42310 [Paraburkholderia caffeinilytica]CAB3788582.1 hypothetical protein LMG28690_02686 [Paraburkholderia caffeinilytica]